MRRIIQNSPNYIMERMKEVYSKMMEVVLTLCHFEFDVAES